MTDIHLVECPRDAIQGWSSMISTNDKIAYYRSLLEVGFDTLDMGSFVSHKAVPQMADTRKVLQSLRDEGFLDNPTRILTIVGNNRGAREACEFDGVDDVGFPFSISEQFQKRNMGTTIEEAFSRLGEIHDKVIAKNKRLIVYISMGFGNPYGEPWSTELLVDWAGKIIEHYQPGVLAISDTVGLADSECIEKSFTSLIPTFQQTVFGAHLHATPWDALKKIKAARNAGCLRFDGALRGIGGCPMAQDELVGNIPTEHIIEYFSGLKQWNVKDPRALAQSLSMATDLFSS
jgi:hydroxymethylglutaryl-CoA lyase